MAFQPDRGWSWVIMAASFGTFLINGINAYSVGMMHMAILNKYQGSVTMASTVVAVAGSTYAFGAPLGVVVVNKTNCRMCHFIGGILMVIGYASSFLVHDIKILLVTYGFITGIGHGFCFSASVIMVCFYFERLRALASGISFGGAGVGMFVAGVFIQYVLDEYGLNGSFLILAALNAHMCLIAMVMRPLPGYELRMKWSSVKFDIIHSCKESFKECIAVCKKVLNNKAYIFFSLTVSLWCFSASAVLVHEPSYAVNLGVATTDQSALLLTAFGIGSTLSRYLVGLSTGEDGLDGMIIYTGQIAIAGVATMCFPFYAYTYTGHMIFCSILGLYTGGLNSQISPLTHRILGMDYFSAGLGLLMICTGATWLTGPPTIGMILDSGGTYEHGFILIGVVFMLSAFCNVIAGSLENRYIPPESTEKEAEKSVEAALIRSHTMDMNGTPVRTLKGMGELAAIGMSLTSLTSRGSGYSVRVRTLTENSVIVNVQDA